MIEGEMGIVRLRSHQHKSNAFGRKAIKRTLESPLRNLLVPFKGDAPRSLSIFRQARVQILRSQPKSLAFKLIPELSAPNQRI